MEKVIKYGLKMVNNGRATLVREGYRIYTIIPDRYEDYKKDLELRKRETIDRVVNDMKHEIGDVKDEHEI